LAEEMRRVLAYFDWRSNWWTERANNPPMIVRATTQEYQDNSSTLQIVHDEANRRILSGKKAYATRQAHMHQQMRRLCELRWDTLTAKLLSMEGRDAAILVEGDYMETSS
jgi:hypothetical protein